MFFKWYLRVSPADVGNMKLEFKSPGGFLKVFLKIVKKKFNSEYYFCFVLTSLKISYVTPALPPLWSPLPERLCHSGSRVLTWIKTTLPGWSPILAFLHFFNKFFENLHGGCCFIPHPLCASMIYSMIATILISVIFVLWKLYYYLLVDPSLDFKM